MLHVSPIARALVLSLACAAPAAALSIYDGFSYSAGDGLDLKSGGSGFSNVWMAAGDYVIGNGSLEAGNLATTGNCASLVPGSLSGEQAMRSVLFSGFGANGTTQWLSFELRPDSDPTSGVFEFSVAPLLIGKLSPVDGDVYAVQGAAGKQFSNVPTVPGAAVLVVVRFDFNANAAANDVASVYFNPTPGLAAPDVAPIVVTDANFDTAIGGFFFFGANHQFFSFDEVRFGDGYGDVAPGSPSGWFDLGH